MSQIVNRIALVLDRSGSMGSFQREANVQIKRQVDVLQSQQESYPDQQTFLTSILFDDRIDVAYVHVPVSKVVAPIINSGGSTALSDAIMCAIDKLKVHGSNQDDDDSYLVFIVTDGGENASRTPSNRVLQAITSLQDRGDWTFTFSVPKGHTKIVTNKYGVYPGNVQEWETSARGFEKMTTSNVAATQSYFKGRSAGVRSMSTMYTDLSNVSSTDLQAKARDVSTEYDRYSVPTRMPVRRFCLDALKTFEKGKAFYQLKKSETVQSYKQMIVEDRDTDVLYGDQGVRTLLGLSENGSVRVRPGDHSKYNVYIQSTSVNRMLDSNSVMLYKR